MWSRKFLWLGLTTGALAAALALGGLWLLVFVVSRDTEPARTVANIVTFCLPGLIVYPVCWYVSVYRHRDYSAGRTIVLVFVTFVAVWAVVAFVMAVGGAYVAVTMIHGASNPVIVSPVLAVAPVVYALMTIIGAVILFVPFLIVATPMAFLHRWLLLRTTAPNVGVPPPTLSVGMSFSGAKRP